MLGIKHTLMVSALSLGLVMGGVAIVSATTSTNDANTAQTTPTHVTTTPMNPEAITPVPVTPEAVTPVQVTPAPVTPVVITPVAVAPVAVAPAPVAKAPVKAAPKMYHYSDGHSAMNAQQHQQMHVTKPNENHQSGCESGHE